MATKKKQVGMIQILFIIYCVLLVWIILFKLSSSIAELELMAGNRSVNLIPFYYEETVSYHLREVLQNLIIFIPIGIYLKMPDTGNIRAIVYGFIFSFALEACQFLLQLGASDITDLITNTLGTAIGVILYSLTIRVFKNKEKTDNRLSILATIATVTFVLFIIILLAVN